MVAMKKQLNYIYFLSFLFIINGYTGIHITLERFTSESPVLHFHALHSPAPYQNSHTFCFIDIYALVILDRHNAEAK